MPTHRPPIACASCLRNERVTVALVPYRSQLPAMPLDHVQRMGAAILRTLDRLGVHAGRAGVVFDRVRLHRGEFISYAIALATLSGEDLDLIQQAATRARLHRLTQKPVAVVCDEQYLLIVIDLRERRRPGWACRWKLKHA